MQSNRTTSTISGYSVSLRSEVHTRLGSRVAASGRQRDPPGQTWHSRHADKWLHARSHKCSRTRPLCVGSVDLASVGLSRVSSFDLSSGVVVFVVIVGLLATAVR